MSGKFLNYTTEVAYQKTVGEIQGILMEAGAERIMLEFRDKLPISVRFSLPTKEFGLLDYSLPCNVDGVHRALVRDSNTRAANGRFLIPARLATREQAIRVGWRVVKDWLEAQLAIIQAGIVTTEQALLPYQILDDDRTVYEWVRQLGMGTKLLTGPKETTG